MKVRNWGLVFCLSIAGWGQRPQFEVASVKVADEALQGSGVRSVGGARSPDPGLFICQACTVGDMLRSAFDIRSFQIWGPEWIDLDRFTVSAKVTPGTTREQLRLMQQALLEDRFGMQYHHDQKEMLRYELVVAKGGAKLKAHRAETEDGGATIENGQIRARWADMSMDALAVILSKNVHQMVTNSTGLEGTYDVSLWWVMEGSDAAGPSISAAVQEQLGLKLEQHKGPVDRVVIDHLEKRPSGN